MGTKSKNAGLLKHKVGSYFKRGGLNILRYIFSGFERNSGREVCFFIELSALNPYASPSKVILGFKPHINISENDIHTMLTGTEFARNMQIEQILSPSYFVVRAGIFGEKSKQVCHYDSLKNFTSNRKNFNVEIGLCHFTDEILQGKIECPAYEIQSHPEFLCDSGAMEWNLRYERRSVFGECFSSKNERWSVPGAKTIFTGIVRLDGKEYVIASKKSFGFIEHIWMKGCDKSVIRLASSNLTSVFTGKPMESSAFALSGDYNGRLSVAMNLEGARIDFLANSHGRSYQTSWECSQSPESEEIKRLHWSVSINSRRTVVDIDVFCQAKDLYVRTIEMPEGSRKAMSLLSGASGTGEIRVYKKSRKNIELVENVRIANVFCELGKILDE